MNRRKVFKKNILNTENFITEDDIADWVNKKNGILLTRKYNNLKTCHYNTNYVCLTGYNNIINLFVQKILPRLNNKINLILIESDVIDIPNAILTSNKVDRIFQWNKAINHEKITCLPIGLNKDRHLESLLEVYDQKEEKKELLMINFNLTDESRKGILENQELLKISKKMESIEPKKTYFKKSFVDGKIGVSETDVKYYKKMSQFKFVLSPKGAGEDCHRTWEALYLGCIPIVLSSSIDEIYQDLPVLVVKSWNEISEDLLNQIWEEYQQKEWDTKKLKLDYWFEKFQETQKKDIKIHFITYGNSLFERAKNRLLIEAKKFYNFESITGYGPEDLDKDFKEKYEDVLTKPRGGGYWIWKYHLIERLLNKLQENDILIYIDAGCHLNPKGVERFNQYIDMLKKSKYGMLSFQMHNHMEKLWTVKEIFTYFKIDRESEIANSGQYLGGILFIKKCQHSVDYIGKMLSILNEDRNLFTDFYNNKDQASYFKDNRHEQSVSSVLRKIMGSEVIPRDETYFEKFGSKKSLSYPIWAMRSKV